MVAIEWTKLDRPGFDRAVEAFFAAENSDLSGEAYAVNGRGGDDGIDILIRRDDRITIVQLKCFPEGFSTGWKRTREEQIRRSFKTALKHGPDEWWLVVPTTLTETERRFVKALPTRFAVGTPGRPAAPEGRPGVPEVHVFDRPQLDVLASKHPALVTHFLRDELLEAARVYNQETALMVDADDVVARVAALAKQADTLDPDWRLDVATVDGVVQTMIAPKRPDSAERSPITLRLRASFSPDEVHLREKLQRVFDYGTPDPINLPASVVSRFEVDGPAFVARTSENVAISWTPAESEHSGKSLTLDFVNDRGRRVASVTGTTTWLSRAARGASLHAEFFNSVTLKFLLPLPPDVQEVSRAAGVVSQAGTPTRTTDGGHVDRPAGNYATPLATGDPSVEIEIANGLFSKVGPSNDRLGSGNDRELSSLSVSTRFAGCDPHDVIRAVGLLERLDGDDTITLTVDDLAAGSLLPTDGQKSVFGRHRDDFMNHRSVAEDLAIVQELAFQHIRYPEQVGFSDRVHLRCLRLLLEGHCVVLPDLRALQQVLPDNIADVLDTQAGGGLRALLSGKPQTLRGHMEYLTFDLFGHDVEVGPVDLYAPQVQADDVDDVQAAIAAGEGPGTNLTLRSCDGYGMWAWLPERFAPDVHDHIRPKSLGLRGFDDAPDVLRAIAGVPVTYEEAAYGDDEASGAGRVAGQVADDKP